MDRTPGTPIITPEALEPLPDPAPQILGNAKVVVDIAGQCAAAGELHHALAAGAMDRDAVQAEIGDIIAGRKPSRENNGETIVGPTGGALGLRPSDRHGDTPSGRPRGRYRP